MSVDTSTNPSPHRSRVAWALVVVAAAVFWPLVQHPSDLLVGRQNGGRNDLTANFLATRMFPRSAVESGGLPLWNPWMLLGQPWIGNPQSAALYPPNWLPAAVSHPAVLSWLIVAHQLWAGVGTYLFCRRLGCRPGAALIGGSVALAAPFCLAQIGEGHLNQVCLAAWIPWAFWAFESWRNDRSPAFPKAGLLDAEKPGFRKSRASGIVLPLILTMAVFCGHIQEAFYLVLLLSLSCLVDIGVDVVRGRMEQGMRRGFGWLGIGIATAGLTAIEVLPIVRQTQQAIRGRSFSVAEAGQISVGWDNLWQLLDPFALGGPEAYRGTGLFYWETLCHFGIVPLLLAMWGIAAGLKRPGVVRWTVLLAFALMFALGPRTPVYELCHSCIPGVAFFRCPSRMLFFASVIVAALAAVGVDQLRLVPASPSAGERVRVRRPLGALGLCLLLAVIVGELAACSFRLLRTVPPEQLRRASPLTQRLAGDSGNERILVRHEHLTDDEAVQHRLCKLPGYEPVPLVLTAEMFRALTDGKDTPDKLLGFDSVDPSGWNEPLLDLLGVRWMVTDEDAGDIVGWTKVAEGTLPPAVSVRGAKVSEVPYALYRNETVLPRAFVVGRAQTLSPGESLSKQLSGWNPREKVLLEKDVLPEGPRAEFQSATIVEYTAQRVAIETTLAAPGYLVLTDVWYPGWKAVDQGGNELPVLRGNYSLRALPLPAGQNRVTMTFKPPLWTVSALVTLATAGLLALIVLSGGAHTSGPLSPVRGGEG